MDELSTATTPVTVKRRKRSAAERLRIVEETLAPGASVARVARSHGINANQVFGWRKLYQEGKLVDRRANGASSVVTRLLPVSVTEAPVSAHIATDVVKPSAHPPEDSHALSGVIHVQLPKAQLRVEGNADVSLLRVILECLLG
jgi:transposase